MIGGTFDEDGCMDLLAVMRIMNQVSQEHAWGLAYELAALMQRLWPAGNCAMIENLAQIYIHRDGFIHEKSLLVPQAKGAIELQLRDVGKQQKCTTRKTTTTTTTTTKASTHEPQQQQQQQQTETKNTTKTSTSPSGNNERTTTNKRTTTTTTSTNKSQQQQQQQQQLHNQESLPPTPPISPELNEMQRRRSAISQVELVSSLGNALYWVLDFGIADDEERKLSKSMEYLICQSFCKSLSLNEVQDICTKRLPPRTQADLYYRELCKTLISETIKLSIFLDKIYTATMVLQGARLSASGRPENNCDKLMLGQSKEHLHHTGSHYVHVDHDELSELGLPLASLRVLGISDWARLWMQVIKELRQRGKLK